MKFATKAIHLGQAPDPATGAVTIPVFLTATYAQDGVGNLRQGYEYSRTGNPSRSSLEKTLAGLEDGEYGLCYASGSAAACAVLNLLEPGDELITTVDVYGGTYRLFKQVYEKYGIRSRFLDTHRSEDIVRAIGDRTRMVWIESPTNPLLNIVDIEVLARTKPQNVCLIVDNTFATPFFQRPLTLGADAVVHSTTKYLGGHSDVIGGAIVTANEQINRSLKFYQNAAGAVPGPLDCFLIQRGIKTLELRMVKHQENALKVSHYLREHPNVRRVYYPGLQEHPNREVAEKQMTGFSGIVSFEMNGGEKKCKQFLEALRLFTLAESLGGVESLACYPYTMTHSAIPESEKRRIGITKSLIRLSVGIESIEDLLADLEEALDHVGRGP